MCVYANLNVHAHATFVCVGMQRSQILPTLGFFWRGSLTRLTKDARLIGWSVSLRDPSVYAHPEP